VPRAPLFWVAIAFVAATAAALCSPLAAVGSALVGAAALAWARARPAGVALIAAGLLLWWRGAPPLIDHETLTARWSGTVVGDVRSVGDAVTFPLELDGGPIVQATLRAAVAPGDRLTVRGHLEPFDEPRNPGEPSRRALALAEGLAGRLGAATLIARDPPDPRDPRGWAARTRAQLSRRLRALVAEPEATVIAGALWGERGTLPHELRDDFQATGTVHVLVTAGLHLGVIAALVLLVLRWCELPRAPAAVVAIVCIAAYAWLSGGHLPSQRAAVMVGLALVARACGARIVSWNAIALAAIVVAVIWPASVTSVSFALSFSCVSAIVLFARPLDHALARLPLPEKVREALALTVSTQIGVWPLSAATFGLVAPYAVLANAIVVPATGVAMLAGIATLAFADVPFAATMPAALASIDVDAILRVVRFVAGLPGARVVVAPPPAFAIVAYDACAVAAATLLASRPRLAIALLVAASAGVLTTTLRPADGRLTITHLDVGQADAAVIRTPSGHVILIDAGGTLERGASRDGTSPGEEAGERIVLAYLRHQGIRRVDLMILTHPHGDHLGACFPIIEAMPVRLIFDSGQSYSGRAYRDCIASATAHHVPIVLARRGMHWSSGDGVTLDVLAPAMPFLAGTGDDVNENSIVVMLRTKIFSELFMGDAGEASEARLLVSSIDLHADVVKVGHHGSHYASTPQFVAAVRPEIAVVSVGRHNKFGHPALETIEAWHRAGSHILRTDQCGAITLAGRASPTTMLPCTTAGRIRMSTAVSL
jgi:competence protein ComEC